ncbi:MAG: asparagine synthase (glutamine-hydrolyzing) [Planctomycetota bacterium]
MCGICGILNVDGDAVDRHALLAMRESLIHRGPDQCGEYVSPSNRCALAHRRLSILDLSPAGLQPMGTGRLWLVYNGEVYNFRELRAELEGLGYSFESETDTEVVLRAYETWGPECLRHFVGMFALAVWDERHRELFLARDRLGVKPLYYARAGSDFIFASEIKAFLFHPRFRAELDEDALDEYLLFRYCARERTLFKGVRQLPPGCSLMVRAGKEETTEYWSIPPPEAAAPPAEKEALESLEPLLRDSVRLHLVADVPVGMQLSGGVDSSLITRLSADEHSGRLDAFTVTFREPGYSEEPYARFVSSACDATLHTVELDSRFFFESLKLLTWHLDEPMMHPNAAGVYLVNRLARSKVKVLLSGEGADEVFGGYDHWQTFRRLLLRRLPARRLLGPLLNRYPFKRYARCRTLALAVDHDSPEELAVWLKAYTSSRDFRALYGHSPRQALSCRIDDLAAGEGELLERCLRYEQRNYLVSLLTRQDKMSMACGMEDRVPFVDHRLAELAARWPIRFKIGERVGKPMLRSLAERYFPADFVRRTKWGFGVPVFRWFAAPEAQPLFQTALDGFLVRSGRLAPDAVRDLVRRARSGRDLAAANTLWTILAFECWFELLIEGKGVSFAKPPAAAKMSPSGAAHLLGSAAPALLVDAHR